jgi:hypothetical protein
MNLNPSTFGRIKISHVYVQFPLQLSQETPFQETKGLVQG